MTIQTEASAITRRKTDDIEIKRQHDAGIKTTEIASHFGVSPRAIRLRYEIIGIDVSEKRRTPKYNVNERFFDEWTSEMAYTLGFILTDGCVSKNTVSISQKEPEPLRAIAEMMASEHPVVKYGDIHTLHISRKSMVQSLAKHGIHAKKSLTVSLPEVPDKYLADFLRGVIDGDGWVHPKGYVVTITSGSADFSEQLTTRLKDVGFPFETKHDGTVNRIKLSGKDEVRRLGAYLYADPTAFSIERKQLRMTQRLTA